MELTTTNENSNDDNNATINLKNERYSEVDNNQVAEGQQDDEINLRPQWLIKRNPVSAMDPKISILNSLIKSSKIATIEGIDDVYNRRLNYGQTTEVGQNNGDTKATVNPQNKKKRKRR